jgi:hypothetical protein
VQSHVVDVAVRGNPTATYCLSADGGSSKTWQLKTRWHQPGWAGLGLIAGLLDAGRRQ